MLPVGAQPVEVVAGVQHRQVAVVLDAGLEVAGRPGEQQPVQGRAHGVRVALQRLGVLRFQVLHARAHGAPLQGLGAERFGPAARRVTQLPGEELDHRVGDVVVLRVGLELVGRHPGADQLQGQVADHLGGGGDLHQVAEHRVDRGVHRLDRLEALPQAQGDRLLAQVGQLPAGDLVLVDAPGRGRQPGLERLVHRAHRFPVRFQGGDRVQREAGVAFGVLQRGDQGGGRGLGGGAGHRGAGHVHRVHAGVHRGHQGGQLPAGGVVGVQVHRQVEALAQRGDQQLRCGRAQQSRHVLDRQDVGPGVDDLLRQLQVVLQSVELLVGVQQVAGVAQGHLGHRGARGAHGLDGRGHLVDVVQRVEDAEDVDPALGGLGDECVGHLGGVRGVAHGVASAQQHLQRDVGQLGAQQLQALPRVLAQEAQRDVVGRPAPDLHGEQLRDHVGVGRGGVQQVAGAHPGGQQRLVRVAEGGVGHPHRGGLAQRLGKALRALLQQHLAPAGRRLHGLRGPVKG